MVRLILGVVLGILAAFVTVALVEHVGSLVFPQAASVGQVNVDDWVATVPPGAKLVVILAWLLGGAGGAFVAGRVARRPTLGWLPAGLVAVASIATITMIPHPVWMTVAALVAPATGGWAGVRLAARGPRARAIPPEAQWRF